MGFFEIFAGVLTGFYAIVPSYGLAIILLTIAVRILLLPLSIKQTRSMREMQRIQPEIKKLQAKNKGDRQKMNEEMMALYKEHGVNPFGGCLPLLMQFPFLIGLFYVVRSPLRYLGYMVPEGTPEDTIVAPIDWVTQNVSGLMETLQNSALANGLVHRAIDLNQFLGLRLDCSTANVFKGEDPSAIGQCGPGLIAAVPYALLLLLMGFTTWYQQKQMQAKGGGSDAQAQQMQLMGRIMPVFLVFIGYSFPTGVLLYWLTTNVWTIGQQRLMLRVAPPLTGKAATSEKDKEKAATPGKGGSQPAFGNGNPPSKPHPSSKKKRKKR
ncbi:MAG TPA: YidC/Oxa1 family membrane protein insertase [Actinomycetota bacterium]|nr:YidC/Oxa1 family membrane protein insertase [Actinomycetota bacterium]